MIISCPPLALQEAIALTYRWQLPFQCCWIWRGTSSAKMSSFALRYSFMHQKWWFRLGVSLTAEQLWENLRWPSKTGVSETSSFDNHSHLKIWDDPKKRWPMLVGSMMFNQWISGYPKKGRLWMLKINTLKIPRLWTVFVGDPLSKS